MLWIVSKSPVGSRAQELIGAFTDEGKAAGACVGPGVYTISRMDADRVYPIGSLLDVEVRVVTAVR